MKFVLQQSLDACRILCLSPLPWAPEFQETAELDSEEPERYYLDHFANVVGVVVTQVH
jgi:hypothetical protein